MLAMSLRPEKGETRLSVGGLFPRRMYIHTEDLPSFPMRVVFKVLRTTFHSTIASQFPALSTAPEWMNEEVNALQTVSEVYLVMPFISVPGEVLYTYFTKRPTQEVARTDGYSLSTADIPTLPFADGSRYKVYFNGEDCTNICSVCFRKCRLPGMSSLNCLFNNAFMSSVPEEIVSDEVVAYDMNNAILADGTVVEHGLA